MERLRGLVVGRWSAAVAAVLMLLGIAMIVAVGPADRDARVDDQLPRGYDSTRAAQLAEALPRADSSAAVAVFTTRDGSRLDPARLAALGELVGGLDVPDLSAPARQAVVVPSEDGEAALSVLEVASADTTVLADVVTALRDRLDEGAPPGVRAEVTGPAAVRADLAAVFEGANVRLLAVTASVVALLLVLTYRSPLLWVVPLLVVGVADQAATAAATRVLAGLSVPWDESTTGILSVLVFGAGTNYALLLISRYRDELHSHVDRYEAMRLALRRTAEAVLASATTVVVGVLSLALSVIPSTRGLGIACAVGIVVAALFVLVALPALLVLLGRWIFWPKVPHLDPEGGPSRPVFWRRVGDAVARRPALFGNLAMLLLAFLALGLLDTRLGLPTAEQFLEKPEAIAASERLAAHFPAGSSDPAVVMTREPDTARGVVAEVDGVASVRVGASAGAWTELQVVLEDPPDSAPARATVERVRDAVDDPAGGARTSYVGGTAAEALDLAEASARDRWVIFPVVLLLVLGALALLLRAVVTPLLLVVTVVGTYVAALGASWWIFEGIFEFSAFDQDVPLFAFLFLVALGVDYNIFLVTRAREEAVGHGSREGMLRALAATGGVITSAGILLAAVFAVLGVLPLVVLAQLGVAICLGVLLDTLLVRTVLVPALALRLGDAFWWPRRVGGSPAGKTGTRNPHHS
jgi:RND superfamily putative drug exporter